MFSTKEFVDASRDFVCVRIETYENKENEERIRNLMAGRFVNTAFCLFDPSGRRRLTPAGRSPSQVLGFREDDNESILADMASAAARYRSKGDVKDAVLPDFLSFSQALNVASADQRLLVFVNAESKEAVKELTPVLKELFVDDDIIGRFHLDFAGKKDATWTKVVDGATSKPAINIIRGGKFGLEGEVMARLPLTASLDEMKTKLLAENKKFAASEKRKVYAQHVMEGKRRGIKYESEIPYGEDRDGDGKMDKEPSRGGGGRNGRRRRM